MSQFIRVLVLLLFVLLPACAKNDGSSGLRPHVSATSSSVKSVKTTNTSSKKNTRMLSKSDKFKLEQIDVEIKNVMDQMNHKKAQESAIQDAAKDKQQTSGKLQQQLDSSADKLREIERSTDCMPNC